MTQNNNEQLQALLDKLHQQDKKIDGIYKKLGDSKAVTKNKLVNEQQSISYQLGKLQLDAFKSWKGLKELPKGLWELRLESIRRKAYRGRKLSKFERALAEHYQIKIQSIDDLFNQVDTSFNEPIIPVVSNLQQKSVNRTLRIAAIMDEFTYLSFSAEADVLQLTPDNWQAEIQNFNPDFLFIESAWQGKESLWKTKVSSFATEVQELIKHCRNNDIPSMLWNKEDPVHFGTFIELAKNVDVVFTTDIDCIKKYKRHVGHNRVYLLPFAAQPKVHNPIELYERKDRFNFAGSFYLKYPERQRDFMALAQVAQEYRGLDIYDRNYDKPHPHYTFPEQFKPFILGSLPASEIDKAYKGYNFGINMNTIKQSQSMFARRVFEMLASNTIVLSNYSRGVRNLFGDLVVCSDSPDELKRQLSLIMQTDMGIEKFRLQGLRKVLSQHTYAHRLEYISSKLNIQVPDRQHNIAVIASVDNDEQYQRIVKMFDNQSFENKSLFILSSQANLKASAQHQVFNVVSDLMAMLNSSNYTHFAYWDHKSYYGINYLLDMELSFSYLNHFDVVVVTKSKYYSVLPSGSVEERGNKHKYKFVDQADLSRSIFDIRHLDCLKNNLEQATKTVPVKALSIDEFNYLENYYQNSSLKENLQKYLSDDTYVKDMGIEYSALLSYTESIEDNTQSRQINLNLLFTDSPRHKGLVVDINEEYLQAKSNFDPKSHRYISSNNITVDGFDSFALVGDIELDSKSSIIFDFYDDKGKQIKFIEQKDRTRLFGDIPVEAKNLKLHLRCQGKSSLTLRKVSLTLNSDKQDETTISQNSSDILTLDAKDIYDLIIKPKSSAIKIDFANKVCQIKSVLPEGKHAYFYLNKSFSREELNLVLNSQVELITEQNCDFRAVFEFQDENKQKISHSITNTIGHHALAIPMECKFIRLGFKITGTGIAKVSKLISGVIREPISSLLTKSDTLVLAKQYPAYDDLYKYGFLHSRLRAYKSQGVLVDMFKINNQFPAGKLKEFEGIDVCVGDKELLRRTLASGQIKKVLVHLIDEHMWSILREFKDQLQIYIWVHGAEIRSWKRKASELESMAKEEVVRQKKLSDNRKVFWQNLIDKDLNNNIQLIFVSSIFLQESEVDIERKIPETNVNIIHNYIDNQIFSYNEKHPEDRFKILSIRPYANKNYGNDMTVHMIEELSQYKDFKKFQFSLYGDGVLFEELVKKVKHFENVTVHKKFLNHAEIAKLHKCNGIFAVPTRLDSQGVSRDEAMSSGLVSLTNAVSAVPEFVDDSCSLLVPGEDYKAMAREVIRMVENPDEFLRLSKAGSQRVAEKLNFDETIGKELKLFKGSQ